MQYPYGIAESQTELLLRWQFPCTYHIKDVTASGISLFLFFLFLFLFFFFIPAQLLIDPQGLSALLLAVDNQEALTGLAQMQAGNHLFAIIIII